MEAAAAGAEAVVAALRVPVRVRVPVPAAARPALLLLQVGRLLLVLLRRLVLRGVVHHIHLHLDLDLDLEGRVTALGMDRRRRPLRVGIPVVTARHRIRLRVHQEVRQPVGVRTVRILVERISHNRRIRGIHSLMGRDLVNLGMIIVLLISRRGGGSPELRTTEIHSKASERGLQSVSVASAP